MNKKRNTIVSIFLLLVVMTIGYALFSETVTIGGTANANGNASLDLYNPDGTDDLDIKVNGVGSSGTAKIDSSRKTLEVAVNFDYPTAYAEIPVKIKNTGSMDLYISDIKLEGTLTVDYGKGKGPEKISMSGVSGYLDLLICEGINRLDLIKSKAEKNIIIKAKWIVDEYESEKYLKNINFTFSINGKQEINDSNTGLPKIPYRYFPGDEICLNGKEDCFNVIGEDTYSVRMLAKYVLTRDGLTQTTSTDSNKYKVIFDERKGSYYYGYWTDDNGYLLSEYGGDPSKKDIWYGYPANVYNQNSNTYKIVEAYVAKLKGIKKISENDKTSLTGRLIYLNELEELGYTTDGWAYCTNIENNKWLTNNQSWWIGTACRNDHVRSVCMDGALDGDNYYWEHIGGVRPVITIDKKYLN